MRMWRDLLEPGWHKPVGNEDDPRPGGDGGRQGSGSGGVEPIPLGRCAGGATAEGLPFTSVVGTRPHNGPYATSHVVTKTLVPLST
jgi:hypothetical protein